MQDWWTRRADESPSIDEAVISAILAGRVQPGMRLGESMLAEIFGVSRTRVREAMMKLEARGIVHVSARRGWFVVEPSADDARAAFHARKVIETGLLMSVEAIPPAAMEALRLHVEEEATIVQSGSVHDRTCALGDFHIHLAEALSNPLLTEIIRDLTARTVLVSMLYQSVDDAASSNADHAAILDAMQSGRWAEAAALMAAHIDQVEAGLDLSARLDPLAGLKDILTPAATRPSFSRSPS
ncbi:GntR family transcriptional regulator [Oceanibaculum pacificum]|uniref:GntR family transcriptional regulator n=1 Tax=Oceanibaculum pacificum TaxID=580166 RepID=A0A154V8G6_9PROT|nr:GntR family transcriptional regulator [Oceanibaculum pacificum]KZC97678.1 GntR family transcriptional regulator [Oceanibaculum pacificum]